MLRMLIILLLIVGCASRLNTNPDEIQLIDERKNKVEQEIQQEDK